VYVFARGEHPVLVFDPEGNFLSSWGEGVFGRPHGILITPDDIAYCADDKDHTVRKCTLDGTVLMTLGTKDRPADTGYDGKNWRTIQRSGPPFNRPTNVALSPTGEMYVSDGYGNARVHKFTPDGRLLFSWGEPGNGPGQFAIVHSVRTDKTGTVYVADRENSRIQLFTPEGNFITQWTDMQKPQGFYMGPDGCLYTTEKPVKRPDGQPGFLPPRVSIWKTDGTLLAGAGRTSGNRATSSRRTASGAMRAEISTSASCRSTSCGATLPRAIRSCTSWFGCDRPVAGSPWAVSGATAACPRRQRG
jgi:hypothetical protein